MNHNIIFILILIISIFFIYNYFTLVSKEALKNSKNIRVAVCFFGLTRSLKHTINSINKNILNPLKNSNIDYDIILHTYDLKYLKLKRSRENNKLDTNEWKLLKPIKSQIDNQDEFDKIYDYKYVKSFGDAWNTKYENTMNVIRQLNSLKQVWKLSETTNKKYDCYLFIRPDLKYTTKLDTNEIMMSLKSNNENTIYTPSWHKGVNGLNDRIAMGNPKVMKIYANRLDDVNDYLKTTKKALHAESFLKYVIEKNNIQNKTINLIGKRVRINGNIPAGNHQL